MSQDLMLSHLDLLEILLIVVLSSIVVTFFVFVDFLTIFLALDILLYTGVLLLLYNNSLHISLSNLNLLLL